MKWAILLTLVGSALSQYSGVNGPNVGGVEKPNESLIEICKRGLACVPYDQCDLDTGYIITDGGGLINKRFGGGEKCDIFTNLCCKIPPELAPPPPPPETFDCGFEYECVHPDLCLPDGTINVYGVGVIQKRIQPRKCVTTYGDDGQCCLRPDIDEHPGVHPVQNCYGNDICVYPSECGRFFQTNNKNLDCYLQDGTEGQCCSELITTTPVEPHPPVPKEPIDSSIPLQSALCGHRNIFDGTRTGGRPLQKTDAQFGEFPWQAIIFNKNYTFECGAVIISDRFVLTAAHCVESFVGGPHHNAIRIRAGDHWVDIFDEPNPYQDFDVAAIYIHDGYNTRNNHNGIALVELATPLTQYYHINTICLPHGPYDNHLPLTDFSGDYTHQECYVSGFGKDSFDGLYQAGMKKVQLPILDHSHCQDLLRAHPRLNRFFQLHDSFLCAGGLSEKDACKGDGGGPLSCWNKDRGAFELVGITSWGMGCGEYGVPGVYIDVFKYVPWIDSIVNPNNEQVTGYGK